MINNVLSLFDGMSCGQLALKEAGMTYNNYYASEIDKHAIKETMVNFPNTIQLGDIYQIEGKLLPKIDLLIGGFPCQSFSFAGKSLNFKDPRSQLFFEAVRLIKETKPKYWLLENVVMKSEIEETISEILGVKPVKINSSLLTAQNRVRLYWANFPFSLPEDKDVSLIDILENKEYIYPAALRGRYIKGRTETKQMLEVKKDNLNKSNCLTTVQKDNVLSKEDKLTYRNYTLKEYCRLQGVPDNYFKVSSENQAKKMLGNGWTVPVISHIFKGIVK